MLLIWVWNRAFKIGLAILVDWVINQDTKEKEIKKGAMPLSREKNTRKGRGHSGSSARPPDHHTRYRERGWAMEGERGSAGRRRRRCSGAQPATTVDRRRERERDRASVRARYSVRRLGFGSPQPHATTTVTIHGWAQAPTTTSARWLSENRPRFGRIQRR